MTKGFWKPELGCCPEADGIHFRVWAPSASRVHVVTSDSAGKEKQFPLAAADGFFHGSSTAVRSGDNYFYRIDGGSALPDPASRFQPQGPHGPSQFVDFRHFNWTDGNWTGLPPDKVVIYELHVGTFSPEGRFQGVIDKLLWLAELGVNCIELMPVAEFPGSRNWGYDGVGLFAPTHNYGHPDDLRRLVDRAHSLKLAVILDVVYNHLGPDGNYLSEFSPHYFNQNHQTVWGPALNFDGPHNGPVREFFIQNALHWIHEYHLDGLRLDATHAIVDEGPVHILHELSQRVKESVPHRKILLFAEDHRNDRQLISAADGGWDLDGVWADDFHHQIRRRLAGDHQAYYSDFNGSIADLVKTIRQGWFFSGQYSDHRRKDRGTDPSGIALHRFVHCIQNHDQIGNRAFGERLNHQIDLSAYRAASALLLMAPSTPLLFMGQEWAASSPFRFFTDHHEELGRQVTEGRRQEFRDFSAFSDPEQREKIPDPQAEATFLYSRLDWSEVGQSPHREICHLYRRLLALRRNLHEQSGGKIESAGKSGAVECFEVIDLGQSTLGLRWGSNKSAFCLLVIVHLPIFNGTATENHKKSVSIRSLMPADCQTKLQLLLSTEQEQYGGDPESLSIDSHQEGPVLHFSRPATAIFRAYAMESPDERA